MSLLMPHQKRLLEEILRRGVEVSPECLVGLGKMNPDGLGIYFVENSTLGSLEGRNVEPKSDRPPIGF
jgi:hypothetical protein